MKTPVVWVTASLAAAILLTACFLIATGTRGDDTPAGAARHHLWKMKNAPAAISAKPQAVIPAQRLFQNQHREAGEHHQGDHPPAWS